MIITNYITDSVSITLNFENKGRITDPSQLPSGMRVIYVEVPEALYTPMALVATSERCYISNTGVGPEYSIILPAFTCLVKKPSLVIPGHTYPLPKKADPTLHAPPPPEAFLPHANNNWGWNAIMSF